MLYNQIDHITHDNDGFRTGFSTCHVATPKGYTQGSQSSKGCSHWIFLLILKGKNSFEHITQILWHDLYYLTKFSLSINKTEETHVIWKTLQ